MIKKSDKYKISENLYKCECGKIFNNPIKLGAHLGGCNIHRKLNGKSPKKSYKGTNFWKNKTENEKKLIHEKCGKTLSKRIKEGKIIPSFLGKHHSIESKLKISKGTSKNYNYDVNRKSGRGKGGYYKDFWCDSTYELAFVIFCLDHNIKIKRNKQYFLYNYNGTQHRYYPDFIINGYIIEIKGFINGSFYPKINSLKKLNKKYRVLFYKDLINVFNYIKLKYNKTHENISDLYDVYKRK